MSSNPVKEVAGAIGDVIEPLVSPLGAVLSPDKPKRPRAPTAKDVPKASSKEVQKAAQDERARKRKARGRASTILTGGDQAREVEEEVLGQGRTRKKTLLGG